MLRPEPMGWVDIVLEGTTAPLMCEAIADAGVFQPDRSDAGEFSAWDRVSPAASLARELRARIRPYHSRLPRPDIRRTTPEQRAASFPELADSLRGAVDGWLECCLPAFEELSALDERRTALHELQTVLGVLPQDIHLELWRSDPKAERAFVPVVLAGDAEDVAGFLAGTAAAVLRGHYQEDVDAAAVSGLVPAGDVAAVVNRGRQYRLRVVDVPGWLRGTPKEGIAAARVKLAETDEAAAAARARIEDCSERFRMSGVRWLIERQNWLENVLEKSHQGEKFVHLGGWAPRSHYHRLVARLKESGGPFLIRFDDGEGHGISPSMMNNPRWARRFELFVNGFGTPGVNEVDPSVVLALVTPLMFGYMFGDVGQGMLLVLVGWALSSRLPWIQLLVPAGFSSMLFGLLYGSIFSVEHLIPALWLHPMEQPLVVLGTPLLFGMLLMLLSLGFGYLEARWRRESRKWLFEHVPLILCYVAMPAALIALEAALAAVVVAVAMLIVAPGPEAHSLPRRLARLPAALLELLEHWMQLAINTLSFTRLGAFALAHAGLSTALLALAELPESTLGWLLVMIVGNLFITALEGLVVSIQTTRLVMFEFFRRFFEGAGRRFQPLTMGDHPGI